MKNLRSFVLVQLVLLVIWFLIVIAESRDVSKRDVHRIILKSGRATRSQRGHRHLKKNPHHHQYHRGSYEDSLESSHEDSAPIKHNHNNNKYRHRYQHKKPKRPTKKYEESNSNKSKLHSFENSEWTPIVSSEVSSSAFDNFRKNAKREESSALRNAQEIEFTTSYPQPYPSLYESNTYLQSFDNFNQKAIHLREPFVLKAPLIIENDPNKYEVRENLKDVAASEQNTFEILAPTLDLTAGNQEHNIVKNEDDNNNNEEESEEVKVPKNKKRRRPLRRRPIKNH